MKRIKTAEFNILPLLFLGIATLLFLSTLFYVFLVNATISNIVERKSLERSIVETEVQIGEFESVYVELRTGITPVFAESLGFNETENVIFAVRGSSIGLAKLGE